MDKKMLQERVASLIISANKLLEKGEYGKAASIHMNIYRILDASQELKEEFDK